MKVRAIVVSTAALLFLCLTTMAHADERGTVTGPLVSAVGSLGISTNATDIFSVQCGATTQELRAQVNDSGGLGDGVRMRVTVLDVRGRAVSHVSPDNSFTGFATLHGGPGHYLVIIQKAADVAPHTVEPYQTTISCINVTGGPVVVGTATSVMLVQDQ